MAYEGEVVVKLTRVNGLVRRSAFCRVVWTLVGWMMSERARSLIAWCLISTCFERGVWPLFRIIAPLLSIWSWVASA